jgi:hypothetical protein
MLHGCAWTSVTHLSGASVNIRLLNAWSHLSSCGHYKQQHFLTAAVDFLTSAVGLMAHALESTPSLHHSIIASMCGTRHLHLSLSFFT